MAKRVSSVKVNLEPNAVLNVVSNIGNQAAYRMAQKARGRVMSNMRRSGRVNTGAMVQGVQVRKVIGGNPLVLNYEVSSSASYTGYQEYGTPAHGPKFAPFMVFQIRGKGPIISKKWVAGIKPGNFFKDALAASKASDALP